MRLNRSDQHNDLTIVVCGLVDLLSVSQTLFCQDQPKHGESLRLPFLAISYQLPSDGLPHYPHWLNTATEVYQAGYESKREPFEVRIKKRPDGSTSMLRVTVVKGVGRCSVIWFAILFTYFKLREVMTPEEMEDFRRWDCDYLGLV